MQKPRRAAYVVLAAIACVFCPGHILGILALFGLGAAAQSIRPHFSWWEALAVGSVILFAVIVEVRHHMTSHRCEHPEHNIDDGGPAGGVAPEGRA